ncbi:MAG: hypothetical protein AMXMBFR7_29790 [Planctomycetota bacterium]
MKRGMQALLLAGAILMAGLTFLVWSSQAADPQAVATMAQKGASENEMLEAVLKTPGTFALSADDIIRLKQAEVPDTVVIAMLEKKVRSESEAAPGAGAEVSEQPAP